LTCIRHGVNSIPEFELMGNSNFGIGIALKKMELINLKLKFDTKKNPTPSKPVLRSGWPHMR